MDNAVLGGRCLFLLLSELHSFNCPCPVMLYCAKCNVQQKERTASAPSTKKAVWIWILVNITVIGTNLSAYHCTVVFFPLEEINDSKKWNLSRTPGTATLTVFDYKDCHYGRGRHGRHQQQPEQRNGGLGLGGGEQPHHDRDCPLLLRLLRDSSLGYCHHSLQTKIIRCSWWSVG